PDLGRPPRAAQAYTISAGPATRPPAQHRTAGASRAALAGKRGGPVLVYAALPAARRAGRLEADEVVDVEDGDVGGAVAVGVQVAGGEGRLEADEVVDVQDRNIGGAVAVGVARGRRLDREVAGMDARDPVRMVWPEARPPEVRRAVG